LTSNHCDFGSVTVLLNLFWTHFK